MCTLVVNYRISEIETVINIESRILKLIDYSTVIFFNSLLLN